MSNLKQMALESVEPVEYKNITEFKKLSIDMDIEEKTFNTSEGEPFTLLITEFEGEFIRVPKSVLTQLKAFIQDDDDFEYFKVIKSGTGKNTKYTVKPL